MVSIRRARLSEMPEVRRLYDAAGYRATVSERAVVFAAHHAGELVGVARLEPEEATLVLRGMQVRTDHQGQGIGMALLTAVAEHLGNAPCYCVPYTHLRAFYGRVGFVELSTAACPLFLNLRATEYRSRGLDVIVMGRISADSV